MQKGWGLKFVSFIVLPTAAITFVLFGFELFLRFRTSPAKATKLNKLAQLRETGITPFLMFGKVAGSGLYATAADGTTQIRSRWDEHYPLQKTPGTFRIVAIGGSTTEQKRDGTHWPQLLEERLSKDQKREVEVINLGVAAYATPHFLTLLALNVLSWQPDLILLMENVNDLIASYFPNFTMDYANKYSVAPYVPAYKEYLTLSNVLLQHSLLYWWLKDRYTLFHTQRQPLIRTSQGNVPMAASSAAFARNLDSFVTLAHSKNIEVLLSTQPFQPDQEMFDAHFRYKKYNRVVTYPLHHEFVAHHRAYNQIIQRVAKQKQALFFDLAACVGSAKDDFIDVVHYTQRGMSKVAQCHASNLAQVLPTIHGGVPHAYAPQASPQL